MNWNQLKKNWQPTVTAFIGSAFGFIALKHPAWAPGWLNDLAAYASFGGFTMFGVVTKGAGVTGVGDNATKTAVTPPPAP